MAAFVFVAQCLPVLAAMPALRKESPAISSKQHDATRYQEAWLSSDMDYLTFVLRRVSTIAIVAGLLCVLVLMLLFVFPFLL